MSAGRSATLAVLLFVAILVVNWLLSRGLWTDISWLKGAVAGGVIVSQRTTDELPKLY